MTIPQTVISSSTMITEPIVLSAMTLTAVETSAPAGSANAGGFVLIRRAIFDSHFYRLLLTTAM